MNFNLIFVYLFSFAVKNHKCRNAKFGNMSFKYNTFLETEKIPFHYDTIYFFIGYNLIKPTLAFEFTFNQQIISMLQCKD